MAPASSIQWSEEKLHSLQAQLTGKWAEDAWPITITGKNRKQYERFLHFAFTSPWLKIEVKYALWMQFESGRWTLDQGQNSLYYNVHHLIRWLNQIAPSAHSLLERSLESWTYSLRTYLVETGHYRQSRHKHLQAGQK